MRHVVFERLESSDQGTFGRLSFGGFTCFTGELPWKDNASNVSCIPKGVYTATMSYSPHLKKKTYLLAPTGARTGIRIHSANLMGAKPPYKAQLNGCIALGEKIGWIDKQKAVLLSTSAVRRFEELMGGQPFTLEVK